MITIKAQQVKITDGKIEILKDKKIQAIVEYEELIIRDKENEK